MSRKAEPWYLHVILYVIIIVLAYVLIRVAIVDPTEIMEQEKYYTQEARLRMMNLREAQILWENKYGRYTDNLDSLVMFIQTDTSVLALRNGYDSLTQRSTDPFKKLTSGEFYPESLYYSPKSGRRFIVQIDTTLDVDTVINRRGRVERVDSIYTIGERYVIGNPDSKDKIGDLYSDALKNTASWE